MSSNSQTTENLWDPTNVFDYNGLYASAFIIPIAIYLASVASLRTSVRRVTNKECISSYSQDLEAEQRSDPRDHGELHSPLGWMSYLALASFSMAIMGLCILWIYTKGWGQGILSIVTLMNASALSLGPFFDYMAKRHAIRRVLDKVDSRVSLFGTEERRTIIAYIVGIATIVVTIFSGYSAPWSIIVACMIFVSIADNDVQQWSLGGLNSIRVLATVLVLVFLIFGAIIWALVGASIPPPTAEMWNSDSLGDQGLAAGHRMMGLGVSALGTGYLIAMIYRHEAKLRISTFLHRHRQDAAIDPKAPNNTETRTDDIIQSFVRPRTETYSASLRLPSIPFSPFSTPIASFALFTHIIVHISAIVLSSNRPVFGFWHLFDQSDSADHSTSPGALAVITQFPPQLAAAVVVPLVVAILCWVRWKKGGEELWKYSEPWVLEVPEWKLVEGADGDV